MAPSVTRVLVFFQLLTVILQLAASSPFLENKVLFGVSMGGSILVSYYALNAYLMHQLLYCTSLCYLYRSVFFHNTISYSCPEAKRLS